MVIWIRKNYPAIQTLTYMFGIVAIISALSALIWGPMVWLLSLSVLACLFGGTCLLYETACTENERRVRKLVDDAEKERVAAERLDNMNLGRRRYGT